MSSIARKLVSGSVFKSIEFAVTVVVTFFLMPFVLRSLGDRLYGFWTIISTFIGYYGMLDFGISSAVNRYVSDSIGAGRLDKSNRIVNTALLIFAALGIFIFFLTVVIYFVSPHYFENPQDAEIFKTAILILGINMAVDLPLRVFGGILYAQLKFTLISVIQILTTLLRTVLVFWALSAGHKIIALAWITVLASVPSRFLLIYFSKKYLPSLRLNFKDATRKIAKTLVSYSVYVFIGNLAAILRFKLDAFVITAYLGLVSVTHYRVGSVMIEYFFSIMLAVNVVLTPAFSKFFAANDTERIRKMLLLATKVSISIAGFISFGFIIWGKHFITRWVGIQYTDAYPILVILAIGAFCTLGQLPAVSYFFGTSQHKFFAWSNVTEGLINLVLSIILIRYFGIVGVAIGTAIPMIVIKLIFQPIYLCSVSDTSYRDYMGTMVKTALVICLCLLFPSLISVKYGAANYQNLAILGVISILIYGSGLWLFLFDKEERRKILPYNLFSKKM